MRGGNLFLGEMVPPRPFPKDLSGYIPFEPIEPSVTAVFF
jgi:hypothetical protein